MSGQNEMLSKAEDIADKVSLGDICSFSVLSKLKAGLELQLYKTQIYSMILSTEQTYLLLVVAYLLSLNSVYQTLLEFLNI